MKKMLQVSVLLLLMVVGGAASAATLAHWTFDDPELGAADGAALPDSDGRTVWRQAATDHSGNGNHLTTWEYSWAGFNWSADSPAGDLSIVNTGNYPAAFTWSDQSGPTGTDIETITPLTFTIEAVFKGTSWSWAHTIVGRDGRDVSLADAAKAPFYLSVRQFNGEGSQQVAVEYTDMAGITHEAVSDAGIVSLDTWYHLAGVSDGSTLLLYLNGEVVAQTDLTASGSTDLRMAIGGGTPGGDNFPGTWSVGRGMWDGKHNDRWFGYIDEVAISDVALDPSSFVIAIPEPATMLLLASGAFAFLRRRK